MNQLKDSLKLLETVDSRQSAGELMTVKRVNALQDAIKALARGDNLSFGRNFKFHRTGYLTQVDYVGRGGGRAVADAVDFPWQTQDATDKDAYKVSVRYGYLNNALPKIDKDLMSVEDAGKNILKVTNKGYVALAATFHATETRVDLDEESFRVYFETDENVFNDYWDDWDPSQPTWSVTVPIPLAQVLIRQDSKGDDVLIIGQIRTRHLQIYSFCSYPEITEIG